MMGIAVELNREQLRMQQWNWVTALSSAVLPIPWLIIVTSSAKHEKMPFSYQEAVRGDLFFSTTHHWRTVQKYLNDDQSDTLWPWRVLDHYWITNSFFCISSWFHNLQWTILVRHIICCVQFDVRFWVILLSKHHTPNQTQRQDKKWWERSQHKNIK